MESINFKTAITLVFLGAVLIAVSIPLYVGKIRKNYFYGFRIRKAFDSEENWYLINRFGGRALLIWSVFIMAAGIACLYVEPQSVLTVAKISFISLLVPIALTLYYARGL